MNPNPCPMLAAVAPPQSLTLCGDEATTTLADPEPTCGPAPTILIPVVSLRMIRERTLAYGPKRINTAADVFTIFRELIGDADRESLWLVCLDTKNQAACVSMISTGTLNASLVHPREVFKTAMLANAKAIILVHNHPSGDCTPSGEDTRITRMLREAGHLLQIELLDHVIIGDGKYLSFQEEGR